MFADWSDVMPLDDGQKWGNGLSSFPTCRVCGTVRRAKSTKSYERTHDCKRALCVNCSALWGFQEFERTVGTARYMRDHGATMYRIRLVADAPPDISLQDHLNSVVSALGPMQAGVDYRAARRTFGVYGLVRSVRDVVLPAGVQFGVEVAIWVEESLTEPEELLEPIFSGWKRALLSQPEPLDANFEAQRIWRARGEVGESLFLHSSGLRSRFGPLAAISPEARDRFSSLAVGHWTVKETAEGSGHWILSVPADWDVADEVARFWPPSIDVGVHELAGSEVPASIATYWRLEHAWNGRKRVARSHRTTSRVDHRLTFLRDVWNDALRAPSGLRRPKARATRGTADDLSRFKRDIWTGRWRLDAEDAERRWEQFWLRRSGIEPRPISQPRLRISADGEPQGEASDER